MKVYYAIDGSAKHFFMAKKSIASLRRHNANVSVCIHLFAEPSVAIKQIEELQGLDVAFVPHDPATCHPTQLKWEALKYECTSKEPTVFVDADTIFFGDVEDLIRKNFDKDFYAREEVGTEKHGQIYLAGKLVIRPQLNRRLFIKAGESMFGKCDATFVFNTGVMIFNRHSDRISEFMSTSLDQLANAFREKTLVYPSSNEHIVEEIAAALVIGASGVSTGLLPAVQAPFWVEFAERRTEPCTVVHAWTLYYPLLLKHVEGVDAT